MSAEALTRGVLREILGIVGESATIPPGPSVPLDALTTHETLASIGDAQRRILFAYLTIAARIAPKLEPFRQRAAERLRIDAEFVELTSAQFGHVTAKPGRVADVFLSPSPGLVDAVARCVEDWRRMSVPLLQKPLPGLRPASYEHPEDRIALDALRALPLFDRIVETIVDHKARELEWQLTASNVEVTPRSMPDLHRLLRHVCRVLDVADIPAFFIEPGPPNAYTVGAQRPLVVISDALLSRLNTTELLFVLGHEVGHIKSGHVKYTTIAHILGNLANAGAWLAGEIASLVAKSTILPALNFWSRRAEYTCDRAGLLACQYIDAAISTHAKLAGLPYSHFGRFSAREFLEQGERFRRIYDESEMARLSTTLAMAGRTHPLAVDRALALRDWTGTGEYDDLLEASEQQRAHLSRMLGNDFLALSLVGNVAMMLAAWSVRELRVPQSSADVETRRMVKLGRRPRDPVLDSIFRVDALLSRGKPGELSLSLEVLHLRAEQPARSRVELSANLPWQDLPKACREAFIQTSSRELRSRMYDRED
jgi:Zn-dependent protease with chaperone function